MLSERVYWFILIATFVAFAILIWFILVPCQLIEYNLGVNLFTSSIFMVFTVVFLSLLTNLREKREWKDVETWVKKRMGKQLYSLFDILARFIYPEHFKPRPSKEELLRILEDLNEMKGATLNENAIYYYFPKPSDDLSAHQLDVLFTFRKYLSDLEIKYFRFIKPEIRISLMEIQRNLDSIESLFDLVKRFESSEEVVKKSMAEPILAIMKEIYKLHKMGMQIHPKHT